MGTRRWYDELLPYGIWIVRDDGHSPEGGIGSYPRKEELQERELLDERVGVPVDYTLRKRRKPC